MHIKELMPLAIAVLVSLPCSAYSHEHPEKPGGPPGAVDEHTAMMLRQHQSMLTIADEWDKAKKAMKDKKYGEALPPVAKMEYASRDLGKFMLHKNPERRAEFLKKAVSFQKLLKDFRRRVETGDTVALKKLTPKIDRACKDCHKTFR